MLSLFPPLLFSRVRVLHISHDFKSATVRIKPSLFNKNLQRSVFGGTIFSAFDPFHSILLWQIFAHRDQPLEAWLKSAEINYKKPIKSRVTITFSISDDVIEAATLSLKEKGKFEVWLNASAIDRHGDNCADARLLVYLRNFKGQSANF